jgi:hypothetical protein
MNDECGYLQPTLPLVLRHIDFTKKGEQGKKGARRKWGNEVHSG